MSLLKKSPNDRNSRRYCPGGKFICTVTRDCATMGKTPLGGTLCEGDICGIFKKADRSRTPWRCAAYRRLPLFLHAQGRQYIRLGRSGRHSFLLHPGLWGDGICRQPHEHGAGFRPSACSHLCRLSAAIVILRRQCAPGAGLAVGRGTIFRLSRGKSTRGCAEGSDGADRHAD